MPDIKEMKDHVVHEEMKRAKTCLQVIEDSAPPAVAYEMCEAISEVLQGYPEVLKRCLEAVINEQRKERAAYTIDFSKVNFNN